VNDLAAAALLGIVQGLTEFLPVSSTAHLILVSDLLKLDPERFGLSFDVALHLGTALAVLLYFARTWIDLVVGLFRGRWRMPALIVLGTAPAAIAGVLFESAVSRELRGPLIIAAGLVVGSIIFVAAEAIARQRRAMSEVGVTWDLALRHHDLGRPRSRAAARGRDAPRVSPRDARDPRRRREDTP